MYERGASKSNTPASSILAISATSMREGFVLYDQDGQEIWACANVDGRASVEVSELKEIRSHLEKIYIQSLVKLFIRCFTTPTLDKKHEPDVYNTIHSFTMLNDWILYKLSGVLQIDPSNGCTSGILTYKIECGITMSLRSAVYLCHFHQQ